MFRQRHTGRLCHRVLRGGDADGRAAQGPSAHFCRFCWEGEDSTKPLLADTCSCRGSLGHVHAQCLLQWQRVAAAPSVCSTCKGPITLPRGTASQVRLPPRWRAWADRELVRLRATTAKALCMWWNRAVAAVGLAYAAAYAHQALTQAPALAVRLREAPPLHGARWELLAGAAAAALYTRVWLPWLRAPQLGLPFVALHASCYAAGAALDLAGARLAARAVAASSRGLAGVLAGVLCWVAAFAGLCFQMSAVQHMHPLHQFVCGYAQGATSACTVTGGLLLRAARVVLLLGGAGSGALGRLVLGAARALPFALHALPPALAFAGLPAPL